MNKNMQLEDEYNSFIDFNSKLKSLESKYNLSSSELRFVKDELKNMKTDINAVKEALTEISRELSKFVKKEEVKVIEKYVSLWDPLKFVTEDQLKEYLNKNGNRKK